jgi:hypothetical protein
LAPDWAARAEFDEIHDASNSRTKTLTKLMMFYAASFFSFNS